MVAMVMVNVFVMGEDWKISLVAAGQVSQLLREGFTTFFLLRSNFYLFIEQTFKVCRVTKTLVKEDSISLTVLR